MKKLLPIALGTAIFLVLLIPNTYGTHLEGTTTGVKQIPTVLILPNSPFYPLKLLKENIELLISFSDKDKFQTSMRHSRSRLSEAGDLLLNLNLKEADKIFQAYDRSIENASTFYAKTNDKDKLKIIMVSEVEKNVHLLEDNASRFPERESVRIIFRSKDITRAVIYDNIPGLIRFVTPITLDNLRQYSFVFDIRPKLKYDLLHIPGSILVPVFSPTIPPVFNDKFPLDDFLTDYKNAESYLIVGNYTGDALDFAKKVKDSEIGKVKEIYILENGFVNYAMNTDYPMEGRPAVPVNKVGTANEN